MVVVRKMREALIGVGVVVKKLGPVTYEVGIDD